MGYYHEKKYREAQERLQRMVSYSTEHSIPAQIKVLSQAVLELMNYHKGVVEKPEGVGGTCGCSKKQGQDDLSLYPTRRHGSPEYYAELRRHDIEWLQRQILEMAGGRSSVFSINSDYAARLLQIIGEGEEARRHLQQL